MDDEIRSAPVGSPARKQFTGVRVVADASQRILKELLEFEGILAPGRGFDTARHIDAPGPQRMNGFGYIFWAQAAGNDQVDRFACGLARREEGFAGGVPVEAAAGAATSVADLGVEQDAGDGGLGGDLAQLCGDERGGRLVFVFAVFVDGPMQCLDDRDGGSQRGAESGEPEARSRPPWSWTPVRPVPRMRSTICARVARLHHGDGFDRGRKMRA